MQQTESSILLKSNQFRVEIRRQKVSKILALKRVKPQPIESDEKAMWVFHDGLQILQEHNHDDETVVKVFRTLADAFKRYSFDDPSHEKSVRQAVYLSVRIFFEGSSYCQTIKQAALQLISCLSFNPIYGLTFPSIPYSVLDGFNLQMIKSCLLALSYLLSYQYDQEFFNEHRWLFSEVVGNFVTKESCFSIIKPHFMNCAVTLCALYHTYNIKSEPKIQSDYMQLLGFCLKYIQLDIIKSANEDPTLAVFFEPFYVPRTYTDMHQKMNELFYPFSNYETLVRLIKEPNPEVVCKLNECLRQQIQKTSVEEPLTRCLSKIYFETNFMMPDDLKDQIFCYIFGLQYAKKQQPQQTKDENKEEDFSLRYIILLMLNEFVNNQNMNGSIFTHMKEPLNQRWPQTFNLLKVMEYLEKTKDSLTQEKLLQLVDSYLTICGRSDVLNQCMEELLKFDAGKNWLMTNGYMMEGLDGRMVFVGREEYGGEIQWEI